MIADAGRAKICARDQPPGAGEQHGGGRNGGTHTPIALRVVADGGGKMLVLTDGAGATMARLLSDCSELHQRAFVRAGLWPLR